MFAKRSPLYSLKQPMKKKQKAQLRTWMTFWIRLLFCLFRLLLSLFHIWMFSECSMTMCSWMWGGGGDGHTECTHDPRGYVGMGVCKIYVNRKTNKKEQYSGSGSPHFTHSHSGVQRFWALNRIVSLVQRVVFVVEIIHGVCECESWVWWSDVALCMCIVEVQQLSLEQLFKFAEIRNANYICILHCHRHSAASLRPYSFRFAYRLCLMHSAQPPAAKRATFTFFFSFSCVSSSISFFSNYFSFCAANNWVTQLLSLLELLFFHLSFLRFCTFFVHFISS